MSETIYAEFNTFCYAIMLGAFCGIIYDIIRIFRRIIKKKIAVTAVEDIIYWLVVSVLMFMLMYRENGGMVRGYAIISMAAGIKRTKVPFSVTVNPVSGIRHFNA